MIVFVVVFGTEVAHVDNVNDSEKRMAPPQIKFCADALIGRCQTLAPGPNLAADSCHLAQEAKHSQC